MHFFLLISLFFPLARGEPIPGEWLVRKGPWDYELKRGMTPVGRVGFQPNFRYVIQVDPEFDKSWGLANHGQGAGALAPGIPGVDVGAAAAWAIHQGDGSVVVAILDSGLDLNHEELAANLWRNPREIPGNGIDDDGNGFVDDVYGWNFVSNDAQVLDKHGHGTLCAGIVGAEADNGKGSRGINARVKLMVVKSLDDSGVGSTAAAVAAIRYAVNNGAAVINASWGGTEWDPALYEAIKLAGERGVAFVAAAGNQGKNNDTTPQPIYPASFKLPAVVSVAAYDNSDRMATFSNYGKETVHLGAPGVAIFSTAPGGYQFVEGTSFSAPFVSGAVALVKSFRPDLTLRELKDRLLATTEVISYYEKEKTMSGGRLNLFNLLRDVRPARPTPPEQWIRWAHSAGTTHPYTNKQSYQFTVEAPGTSHVRVHFKGFQTEECCDIVRLLDREGRTVATYSGNLGDFWAADALGDRLSVEMTTDYSVTAPGFEIDAFESASP